MPGRVKAFHVPEITFVGEQTGAVEHELKVRLATRFRSDPQVNEAYLVRVRYGDSPEIKVAVCLEAGDEFVSQIVEATANEFHRIFNPDESMDVVFLSPEQHARIASLAQPFYRRQA
ncbi:MAG TPA: enhanced serine sensitivity protein SseB C-terminal domain-containing protein [Bryobacteraceae bacterium]|jgi:hypothetical protein|nr:enhanced serine sensitivity protein SseB C-terminal domain-containing protein [Bryobacteraceae bacterium]